MTPFYDQIPIQERTHPLEMPPEVRALESILDSFARHAFLSLDEDVPLFLLVFIADVQEHVPNTLNRASWLQHMVEKLIDCNRKISFPATYSKERRQAHQAGLVQLLDLLTDPSAASLIVKGERLAKGEWFFRESFQAYANVLQDVRVDQERDDEGSDLGSSVSDIVRRAPRTPSHLLGAYQADEADDKSTGNDRGYSAPADFVRTPETSLTVPPRKPSGIKYTWKPEVSRRLRRP
ncbi:hypothetical protein KBB27_00975 [Patescibacteria group bacterium]|nr:hypothetical protein [Patescibacteria group bacterium]